MRWTVKSPSSDLASLVMTLSYGLIDRRRASPPSGGAGGVCAAWPASARAAGWRRRSRLLRERGDRAERDDERDRERKPRRGDEDGRCAPCECLSDKRGDYGTGHGHGMDSGDHRVFQRESVPQRHRGLRQAGTRQKRNDAIISLEPSAGMWSSASIHGRPWPALPQLSLWISVILCVENSASLCDPCVSILYSTRRRMKHFR